MPDYLPPESAQFVAVRDGLLDTARAPATATSSCPIFGDTALFARGVGGPPTWCQEMYVADRGDRSVTRRPEGTAGDAR